MLTKWTKLNKKLKNLNNKLEKIKESEKELLEKNNLIRKWNSIEKRRLKKQKKFSKKFGELRTPIMQEIGELLFKKEQIRSRKEKGSIVECDNKIQKLNRKYGEIWKNVLGPINEEIFKLVGMQRTLLRKESLLGTWDKLEKKKRKIDLEIVDIKQKLKEMEKSSKVKMWVAPHIDLINKEYVINNLGTYDLKSLINLFESWKKNSPKRPYFGCWHITGACNSNCIMCEQRDVKNFRNTIFDMRFANRVLTQLKNIGVTHLSFSGGEPTLVKNLIQIIKKAKNLGFITQIYTNIVNLNEKFITNLYEAGLDIFFISLDSANSKIHDAIRGVKCWDKVVKAIRFIKENTSSTVIINTVVQRKNYKNIDKMVDLVDNLNVDFIMFSQVDSFVKDNSKLRLNKKQMKEYYFKIVPKILKKSIQTGVKVDIVPLFFSLLNKSERFAINQLTKNSKKFEEEINNFSEGYYGKSFYGKYVCYTPFRRIEIMPNGDVHPCCPTMYLDEFAMGNIKKQSLFKIFNSSKFKEFRKNVKEFKSDICKVCRYEHKTNYQLNRILKW